MLLLVPNKKECEYEKKNVVTGRADALLLWSNAGQE